MGIVGPLVSYGLFKVLKGKAPKSFRIFIASALGALSTYVVTAVQLAFAHPQEVGGVMASFTKFFGIFAVTPSSTCNNRRFINYGSFIKSRKFS